MKRIGFITLNIYDEQYDLSKIRECCILVTDEQIQSGEAMKLALSNQRNCTLCMGCPTAEWEYGG